MKLYRVHTEYRINLPKLVNEYFEGFTTLQGIGYYKGQPEDCTIIEVVTEDSLSIGLLCEDIKRINNQEEVLCYAIEL